MSPSINGDQQDIRIQERKTIMSTPKEQKREDKKDRARVGNLPQQEKELKEREAENIKGGGGAAGGVVNRGENPLTSHIGEEIPSSK
jgi:hypothetical protein